MLKKRIVCSEKLRWAGTEITNLSEGMSRCSSVRLMAMASHAVSAGCDKETELVLLKGTK
jgi:hypothetical protein